MRFISLFAGIGGFDLGLEAEGMDCAAQIEINKMCLTWLTRHWPEVPKWADVAKFSFNIWRDYCEQNGIDPHVDLLVGGFPCQGISTAGKGKGLKDKRSGLWSEFYRLILEFKPRWTIIENVPALRTRGADRVLADLEQAGYSAEAIVVGAWAVGAPHKRNRVWIVGHTNQIDMQRGSAPKLQGKTRFKAGLVAHANSGKQQEGKDQWAGGAFSGNGRRVVENTESERIQGRAISAGPRTEGKRTANADGADKVLGTIGPYRRIASNGEAQCAGEAPRLIEFRVGRPVDGVRSQVAESCNMEALAAYGNAVVPQVVQAIAKCVKRIDKVIYG